MKIFLIIFLIAFLLVSFSVIAYAFTYPRPAGPGLGWHNDWWNPQTQKIEAHP